MKKSLPLPTSVMDMAAVSSEDCVLTMDCCFQDQQTMGLLLSCSPLRGVNNTCSLQSAFNTGRTDKGFMSNIILQI